ncbi:hypothetical protein OQ968_24120 [Mycobacterium sp. 663a-19]|uniref:DUF7159 family protein n=1 Tax=Mycobacterium sp. 663a-19 TaxID=2986148 RepID=UPI002D1F6894|nr:hypothetical protein [Mycobacterium sp. 663a-19]
MAAETVRMVLIEGAGAGGVTVDQDDFDVSGRPQANAAVDRAVAAIVGTRESAVEGGHHVLSSGVAWTDQAEAAALRDALAERKIENIMLVSAFMAAAALAQAVGSATNCARTALLFVEPASATLAVVDSSDGSIVDTHRRSLPPNDDAALEQLTAMVSGAESMKARPDGVFLVGSGVDLPSIKPTLEAATSLSLTAPEEPEMALARGAALASANAQLGAPSTVAMPDAGAAREARAARARWRSRKPLVAAAIAAVMFVGGAVAVALDLAFSVRPHVEQRPDISKNVIAPTPQAPPPPPSAVSAPETAAPPQQDQSERPRDKAHDWLHRHLGPGILGP